MGLKPNVSANGAGYIVKWITGMKRGHAFFCVCWGRWRERRKKNLELPLLGSRRNLSLENKWPASSPGRLGICHSKQKAFVVLLSGVSCTCVGLPPSVPSTHRFSHTLPEVTVSGRCWCLILVEA